jgi:hypothetical protein
MFVQEARTQSSKLGICSCPNPHPHPHQLAPLIMLLADTTMESPSVQAIHLLLVHLRRHVGDFMYAKQSRALNAHGSMSSIRTTPSQYHSTALHPGAWC